MAFYDKDKIKIGDRVYDRIDPRHVGWLVATTSDLFGTIRWDNGQVSTLPMRHLVKEAVPEGKS